MNSSTGLTEGFLFTDQYQLSMAQLYWREGLHETTAQFDYFFRRYPDYGEHQAGYAITAGLGPLLDWMASTRITDADIAALRSQRTTKGNQRFDDGFLTWLREHGRFDGLTVRAIPEGRVVHATEPIAIVEGPLGLAQIVETSFLNHMNYPTLIATKASRIVEQARGGQVLEFGLRRGPRTGANAGTRAALIGGADGSSNVGVSHALGADPKGTHAHAMVQLFMAAGGGELAAFRAYADVYPDECLLLVDTIDTLTSGVPNAITVFDELRSSGHEPLGIRLDSGDLAHLAVRSARMLDDAGYETVSIVLSSDLDELAMWQIREQINQEAPEYGLDAGNVVDRLVYGVGSRLISSHGDPSLGGVFKLVAVRPSASGDRWTPAIKISDSPSKMPIPGRKRLWRVYDARGLATADVVSLDSEHLETGSDLVVHDPHRPGVTRSIGRDQNAAVEELHVDVFGAGQRRTPDESLDVMRRRRQGDLARLDVGVRRLVNPHRYHVSVTTAMRDLQADLVRRTVS
ncbi:MAG: nicotinate phosphoribosyltransferase [Acidimicrobiia bacterium]|nr:nicotinate phosphoribosyltransferase [Acidimicrobiia bacterium]